MKVSYAPNFVRQFKAFDDALRQEILEKIHLFQDRKNHKTLKVHKLHGRLVRRYSFSVNYRFRIVFSYLSRAEAVLLAVGDHSIYF